MEVASFDLGFLSSKDVTVVYLSAPSRVAVESLHALRLIRAGTEVYPRIKPSGRRRSLPLLGHPPIGTPARQRAKNLLSSISCIHLPAGLPEMLVGKLVVVGDHFDESKKGFRVKTFAIRTAFQKLRVMSMYGTDLFLLSLEGSAERGEGNRSEPCAIRMT